MSFIDIRKWLGLQNFEMTHWGPVLPFRVRKHWLTLQISEMSSFYNSSWLRLKISETTHCGPVSTFGDKIHWLRLQNVRYVIFSNLEMILARNLGNVIFLQFELIETSNLRSDIFFTIWIDFGTKYPKWHILFEFQQFGI